MVGDARITKSGLTPRADAAWREFSSRWRREAVIALQRLHSACSTILSIPDSARTAGRERRRRDRPRESPCGDAHHGDLRPAVHRLQSHARAQVSSHHAFPEWHHARLEYQARVSYEASDGTSARSPIDSFSPSFSLNAESAALDRGDSQSASCTRRRTCVLDERQAIGDTAARLRRSPSTHAIQHRAAETEGWADCRSSGVMSDCIITSAMPSRRRSRGCAVGDVLRFQSLGKAEPKFG